MITSIIYDDMTIAKEVLQIAEILKQNNYKAYLVGGCLRDLLTDTIPKDWDIATDALPEKVHELFPDSVYENSFGTVGIKTRMNTDKGTDGHEKNIVEVTTFRTEGAYSDKRRPDEVKFVTNIEDDLARRDFTVNALALDLARNLELRTENIELENGDPKSLVLSPKFLVDPFDGLEDLKRGILRAVGDAGERFREDALRLMRAVRFHAQLGFTIEKKTLAALQAESQLLEHIAKERIRDELSKLVMTTRAVEGVEMMREAGLLKYILPELLDGVDCEQNQHHIYDVYTHNLKSFEYSVKKDASLTVRLASLLHDVGKPATRVWKNIETGKKTNKGKRGDWTFYGHQVVGARIAAQMLERLHFSKEIIEDVYLLVYEHMFVYDPEVVTLAGVRRLLARVGANHIDDLIKVREADRIGSGVPKAQPYRLRYLLAMLEKVKSDPISAKMLKINGNDIMKLLDVPPGPILGKIIAVLLEDVLADPEKNEKEWLLDRAKELAKLTEKKLEDMASAAKTRAREAQQNIDEEIKKKYFVK